MGTVKKTVSIKNLLEWANHQLAREDEHATQEFKAGISVMLEEALHQANAYNGFRFLKPGDNKVGSPHYYTRCYFSLVK